MKNVLIVTQKFPPYNSVAVIRVAKFVKYLRDYGWNPIVLTCKRDQDALDYGLLDELPEGLEIHRVFCPSLYEIYRIVGGRVKQGSFGLSERSGYSWVRELFVPDPYVGWLLTGVLKARSIFKKHHIDMIFSTSPRETPHLIARLLQRWYQRPWVADFRDPWIEKNMRQPRPRMLDNLEKRMQSTVVQAADKITVAWPGIAAGLQNSCTQTTKFEVLTNGFDEEDFWDISPQKYDKFTVLFPGALYETLAPEPIFQAFSRLSQNASQFGKEAQLVLLGRQDAYVRHLIEKHHLSQHVCLLEQMPLKKSLAHVMGADVLFLSVPDRVWVPSKVFEYLKAGRPILALASDNSDAVQLINSVQPGLCFASRSPEKIADYLQKLFDRRCSNKIGVFSESLKQYSRVSLTKRLADIFNEVVCEHNDFQG